MKDSKRKKGTAHISEPPDLSFSVTKSLGDVCKRLFFDKDVFRWFFFDAGRAWPGTRRNARWLLEGWVDPDDSPVL
jgi:hypothetical protein